MSGRFSIDSSESGGKLLGNRGSLGACSSCSHRHSCMPKPLVDSPYLPIFESAIVHEHSLDEGESLLSRGAAFRSVYVVKSGSVKSTAGDKNDIVSGFFFPGSVLGLEAFAAGVFSGDIIALERCRVCEIDFDKLLELSTRFPELQRNVFFLFSEYFADLNKMASVVRSGSVEQRTAAFLISISDLYNRQRLSRSDVVLPMSRPDIIDFLGVSPESLSRALSALSKKRFIKVFNRRVSFLDIEGMRAFSKV